MAEISANYGIMLCGHGSRDKQAVTEFAQLAQHMCRCFPNHAVEYGYLEFANPIIANGLDRLREQGIKDVLAVPGMLFAAGHAKNDIPSVLNNYMARHPEMQIHYGRELGIDPKMIRAAGARIQEALANEQPPYHDTLLMLVGRGASDPDANSNIAKIMRLLWEGLGFGWGEISYSGVTFPLVAPALDQAARLGFRRIVVFPYFLFTGILVRRIYDAVETAAIRYPEIDFIKAPYLSDHPLVIDTFADRLSEILVGSNVMNCQLCKYREQVLGFEDEVGLPQKSHHHHVEGISTDIHKHSHDHETKHSHDKGHGHGHDGHGHHHPYPHADHPLGPRTL